MKHHVRGWGGGGGGGGGVLCNDTATTEIYTLSLHDALPIFAGEARPDFIEQATVDLIDDLEMTRQHVLKPCERPPLQRSEEHTSELQSRLHLVCRLLLEKKKNPFNLCPSSLEYSLILRSDSV